MYGKPIQLLMVVAAVVWSSLAGAQTLPPERVFSGPSLAGASVRAMKFSPDSRWVAYLRSDADTAAGAHLWVLATEDGAAPVRLLDPAQFKAAFETMSEGARARQERQRIVGQVISNFRWHPQSDRLLLSVGDSLFEVTVPAGGVAPLDLPEKAGEVILDPRYSPDGSLITFVGDGVLKTFDPETQKLRSISPKSGPTLRHGVAEFIAQEEMARDRGYWWAPTGKALAYATVDDSDLTTITRLGFGQNGLTSVSQLYPYAGGPNSRVSMSIWQKGKKKPVKIDWTDGGDWYMGQVAWSLAGDRLYIQRLSRDQQTLHLLAVNPKDGSFEILLEENQTPWVELNRDFRALPDGGFLWVSQRSGYQHAYRYAKDGRLVAQLTDGDFPLSGVLRVQSIAGLDQEDARLFVRTSPENATQEHLYAASLEGLAELVKLTGGDGWWEPVVSPNGKFFAARMSNLETPPNVALYDTTGQRLAWIEENPLDESHPYYPYRGGLPTSHFGQIEAEDGQMMDYIYTVPAGARADQPIPAILKVYGGPGAQRVKNRWPDPEDRLWLEAGYALLQMDNRGAGHRGLAFQAPVYKALAQNEVRDQIRAVNFLKAQPEIDGDRIGVMGWSYGGYMTLHLMTEPNSGLAAGAAGAAPGDWRQYDTFYTEKYLGLPQDGPDIYDRAAVLPRLENLHGHLMVLHGMSDDNVLVDNALAIMGRLQQLGKVFDLMLYPGQAHGIVGSAEKKQLWAVHKQFFDRVLKSEQPVANDEE